MSNPISGKKHVDLTAYFIGKLVKEIVLDKESINYIKTDIIVNFGSIYGILKENDS